MKPFAEETTPWTQVPKAEHAPVVIAFSSPPQWLQPPGIDWSAEVSIVGATMSPACAAAIAVPPPKARSSKAARRQRNVFIAVSI
jgi:hypothetical protein